MLSDLFATEACYMIKESNNKEKSFCHDTNLDQNNRLFLVFQKKSKHELKAWNFHRYRGNTIWKFQGFDQKRSGISRGDKGIGFWPLNFQGV